MIFIFGSYNKIFDGLNSFKVHLKPMLPSLPNVFALGLTGVGLEDTALALWKRVLMTIYFDDVVW